MNAHQRKVARDQGALLEAGRRAREVEASHEQVIAELRAQLAAAEARAKDEAGRASAFECGLDAAVADVAALQQRVARITELETLLEMARGTERELRAMLAAAEKQVRDLLADERDVSKLRRRLRDREAELALAQKDARIWRAKFHELGRQAIHFTSADAIAEKEIRMAAVAAEAAKGDS